MNFQRERFDTIFDEAYPLFELHFKEIAHYQDIPLAPELKTYTHLEDIGAARTFTSRDESGALIGYAVFFVKHNIHYSSSLQASQDIIFLHPEKRGEGYKFIAWCDEQLRAEGVQVVYHHTKAKHSFGPTLERMGYELVDLIYGRRLD